MWKGTAVSGKLKCDKATWYHVCRVVRPASLRPKRELRAMVTRNSGGLARRAIARNSGARTCGENVRGFSKDFTFDFLVPGGNF